MLLVVLTDANNQNLKKKKTFLFYSCEICVVGIMLKTCLLIDTDGRKAQHGMLLNALN